MKLIKFKLVFPLISRIRNELYKTAWKFSFYLIKYREKGQYILVQNTLVYPTPLTHTTSPHPPLHSLCYRFGGLFSMDTYISRKPQYKDVSRRTIEIPQFTCIV